MASTYDFLFVGGIVVLLMAFTSFLNAFSGSRPPKLAILLAVVGVLIIAFPVSQQPQEYRLENLPDIIIRTIADIVR